MPYRNAKIYSDGSHYIAIPQTNNSNKKKKSPVKGVCEGKVTQALNGKTEKKNRLRRLSLPRNALRDYIKKITARRKSKR